MTSKDELDSQLIKKLEILNDFPLRNPEMENSGRMAFLEQAQILKNTVTNSDIPRHSGWIQNLNNQLLRFRKEHSPMTTALATLFFIASLLFGTGGVTVVAAQSSQPDDPLYGVKIWSEDVRINLISDPFTAFQLSLDFANRRSEEIMTLLEGDATLPDNLLDQYQTQVEQTIQFALNLPEDQAKLDGLLHLCLVLIQQVV